MWALLALDHALQAIGRLVGQLTALALIVLLFLAPVFAMLLGCVYAAVGVEKLTGGGAWVWGPLFWVFIGVIGWYVSPHIQPQIGGAMTVLMKALNSN